MTVKRRRDICRLADLAPGEARGLSTEGGPDVVVVRLSDDVRAYRDLCPHYGTTRLAFRRDRYLDKTGRYIVCAAHGALFRIEDGVCVSGPCTGERLTSLSAVIEGDEIVVGAAD